MISEEIINRNKNINRGFRKLEVWKEAIELFGFVKKRLNNLKTVSFKVKAIRNVEKSLGNGIKKPSPSETKNIPIARKSIVAIKPIKKGELFTIDNIGIKRPGNGISPMRWYEIIDNFAKKDYKDDALI